jgi:tRNA-Thr(GGU) m(6)t(6)A37 methyltransferase TsaA
MNKNANNIRIQPIGFVRNDFESEIPQGYEDSLSEIIIRKDLSQGLHKLEENSHIVVVFWMDRVKDEDRNIMKMHPKGREDLPLLGVFATRSPRRPNPMGIRAVRLVERNNNVLKVKGLDALNGTPILDIKPYSSKHDLVADAKTPWWVKRFYDKRE